MDAPLGLAGAGEEVRELGRESEAAVAAKMLLRQRNTGQSNLSPQLDKSNATSIQMDTSLVHTTHLSQNGTASSLSLPTPDNVFFCTTANGRVR